MTSYSKSNHPLRNEPSEKQLVSELVRAFRIIDESKAFSLHAICPNLSRFSSDIGTDPMEAAIYSPIRAAEVSRCCRRKRKSRIRFVKSGCALAYEISEKTRPSSEPRRRGQMAACYNKVATKRGTRKGRGLAPRKPVLMAETCTQSVPRPTPLRFALDTHRSCVSCFSRVPSRIMLRVSSFSQWESIPPFLSFLLEQHAFYPRIFNQISAKQNRECREVSLRMFTWSPLGISTLRNERKDYCFRLFR